MNQIVKPILSSATTIAVAEPKLVHGRERADNLFERAAWIYTFCREKVFRDDTGRIIRAFWPAGEPPASSRVLELGCGPGFYARTLASRFRQISVLGVDSSKELVNSHARKQWLCTTVLLSGVTSSIFLNRIIRLANWSRPVFLQFCRNGNAPLLKCFGFLIRGANVSWPSRASLFRRRFPC